MQAYESGITFFDTARFYTDSEEKIGFALSDVRENIIMYKLAMHLAEDMKNRGIITDEEYVTIEQKMCEKFSIKSTSIYRNMT